MKNTYLYTYNSSSEGARELCKLLGIRRIRHENSKFVGNKDKVVINWGSTSLPDEIGKCTIINTADAVLNCSDKVLFFEGCKNNFNIPEYTLSFDEAKEMVKENNTIIFCRTLTKASGGRGIVEATTPEEVVKASLYTKYIPKNSEWRLHICEGDVFLIQRKGRNPNVPREITNWHIRNHDNGFIFVRNDGVEPPKDIIDQAQLAFKSIKGLTFGSVDIIYNNYRNKAYVLEINTASGLQGSTLQDYVDALKKIL